MMRTWLPIAGLSLLLAGCGGDAAPSGEADPDASAQGEILGGSISDEMLPTDRLESQSPPMASEPGSDGYGSGSAAADRDGEDEAASEAAAPDEPGEPAEPAAPENEG